MNVTLFQASEENSAPTMATPTRRIVSQFHPRRAPEIGEVALDRRLIAPEQEAEADESEQRGGLGEREHVLDTSIRFSGRAYSPRSAAQE